jgi:hypothetical protein
MYLMYTLYTGKDATASSYSALAVSSSWLTTSSSFSMTPTWVTKHSTVQYVQEGCNPRRCRFGASCWLGALLEWGPVCICPTARHAAVRGNSSYGPQTAMRHSSTSGQPTPVGSVGSGGSQWAAHNGGNSKRLGGESSGAQLAPADLRKPLVCALTHSHCLLAPPSHTTPLSRLPPACFRIQTPNCLLLPATPPSALVIAPSHARTHVPAIERKTKCHGGCQWVVGRT